MNNLTVREFATSLSAEVLVDKAMDNKIVGGYVGDLLSVVMGKAMKDDALITVMGNINTVAVASLTDISCIILSESSPLDENAKEKATYENIPILKSEKSSFEIAVLLGKLLGK